MVGTKKFRALKKNMPNLNFIQATNMQAQFVRLFQNMGKNLKTFVKPVAKEAKLGTIRAGIMWLVEIII